MVLCEEHRCAMEWGLCSQLSLHQTLAHALPMAKIALNQGPNLPKFHLVICQLMIITLSILVFGASRWH